MDSIRLTVRVDFGSDRALGPGKIRLLEEIHRTGSISEAGRTLKMSYRRAWLLVDDMNRRFHAPVVATRPGGAHGGGAELTVFGRELIEKYRLIEAQAAAATKPLLRRLEASLRQRNRHHDGPPKTSMRDATARR